MFWSIVLSLITSSSFASVSHFTLSSSVGPIGKLTVTESGNKIDTEWREDDNGRGSKITEHIELKNGLPIKWELSGTSEVGAPVKESFVNDGTKSKWKTLNDSGESEIKNGLYVANNGSPWAMNIYLQNTLSAKNHARDVLPAGSVRIERIRDVKIGKGPNVETVTAYAFWGFDVAPQFILARKNRLVATLSPGYVLVEDKHKTEFKALSALASELSADTLKAFTRKYTHPIDGPLWLTNVKVFDPHRGSVGEITNVGTFRGIVTYVGENKPPADAYIVDGKGGTLLPGLFDSHDHLNDWGGPLHMASGVTFGRDPGNDATSLLLLEKRIDAGEIMGPRMKNSGFIEGKSPFSANLGFVVDNVESAKEKVRWYSSHGFWGMKIYNSMNPDFVKPIADEAHRLGMHVSGHVPAFMSSERAIRDGYDEINHINQLMLSLIINPLKDDTRTPFRFTALGERMAGLDLQSKPVKNLIALMKERKITLDPTMSVFSMLLNSRPGVTGPADVSWLDHAPVIVQRARRTAALDIKPEQYPVYDASWKKLEETLRLLFKEGVPLVPGTDDTAGIVLLSELETWVRAGIPPAATLTSATLGGAKLLGWDSQMGTIERGKFADFYLVDGDPLQDFTAMRRGVFVTKAGAAYYPDEIYSALGVKPFAKHITMTSPAAQ